MIQSLHNLASRATRLIVALVALLAVGLTANADTNRIDAPIINDLNVETVGLFNVHPTDIKPFNLYYFDLLTTIDGDRGLTIYFREPICGADGPLVEGAHPWRGVPDGYQFTITTRDSKVRDCSTSTAALAKVLNGENGIGLFFPLAQNADAVDSGDYSLTIPAGCLYFPDGKVNEEIHVTWTLLHCESNGTFGIVSPQAGHPYRSISQLEVESKVMTHYVGISSINEHVPVEVLNYSTWETTTVWASGSIVDDRAVFTLVQPIIAESATEYQFTIPAGYFVSTNGRYNPELDTRRITVDPNIAISAPVNTYPILGNPASIEEFQATQFAYDQPGFLVRYLYDAVATGNEGRLWATKPGGFQFTYTSPDGTDYRDMSWMWQDIIAYNKFDYIKGIDIPMPDIFEGTYHLVVPEASFQLTDGTYNEVIDCTWEMIHTFTGVCFEVVAPNTSDYQPYMDYLMVYPTEEARKQWDESIDIVRGAAEPVNVSYSYTSKEGYPIGDSVKATVTVDNNGYATLRFAERIAMDYSTDITFTIHAGSFFCENGYGNNQFTMPKPYHVVKPDYFWLSGETEPAQQMRGPAFSTITITSNEPLSALGQNQMMDIRMLDGTNKTEYINGPLAPKSVTLTTNADGQSVITIELPDEVVAAMTCNNNEKIIDIELAGYTDEGKIEGVSPDQCFVKNAEGVPNAPASFFFIVDPTAEYTYSFSFAYAAPANYSITIDGHTEAANEYGVVNFPHITRLLKAEDITVNGVSDEVIYHFGRPEYDWETGGLYVHVDLMLDVEPRLTSLSFCDVPIDFPTATIPIDKVSSAPYCSFLFDREIDPNSISQQILAEHCTIADVLNHQRYLAWFSTGANWMGFGIDAYSEPLAVGTYYFHIDEHTIRFIDGKWNDPIDFSIEITGYPDFEYTTYAVGYMTTDQGFVVEENVGELLGGFHTIALGYNPQRYSFTEPVMRPVEAIIYTDANPEGFIRKGNLVPVTDAQGNTWLGLSLPDPTATGPSYIIEEGSATICIPAGAIVDDHGATNEKDINLWFRIADYTVMIYVNGKLSYDYVIQYTKYQDEELPFELRPRYNATTGDHIGRSVSERPTFLVPSGNDPFYRYEKIDLVGLNYNIYLTYVNTNPYYINDYVVDGKDGLRNATLTFNTPSSPFDARAFHKKANWSDGFRLTQQRTAADGSTVELEADTNISYVTTECSGQSVTLHFFTAEGVEFYPLEQGNTYYLEVPFGALFMSTRHFGGLGRTIDGLSFTNTAYKLRFNLEGVPEIVTGDSDYDAAANRTFVGKANSLAEILLGKRRNGSSVNDIDGNGEITITDIVRLINRHIHVTGSGGSTGTGSGTSDGNGSTDEYPEGWHPVLPGAPDNPGDEAL